jgi:predicted  nucleic acid-binding Zn-ribbon protein
VFVSEQSLKPNVEAALRKVMDQKGVVDGFQRQINGHRREIETIYAEQNRIRENMKALKGSAEERALLQRYTRELDGQEDRIAELKKEITALELRKESANAALDQMVADIALDETL